MNLKDPAFHQRISRLVDELETQTNAEVVMHFTRQLRSYWSLDLLVGLFSIFLGYSVMNFIPVVIEYRWMYAFALLAGLLGLLASILFSIPERFLVRKSEIREDLKDYALANFYEKRYHKLNEGQVIMITITKKESVGHIHFGPGVSNLIPQEVEDAFSEALRKIPRGRFEMHISGVLTNLKPVLATHLPADKLSQESIQNLHHE